MRSAVKDPTKVSEVVPIELTRELGTFIVRARQIYTHFMEQNSEPKSEWRMFYARRWQDAEDVANLTASQEARRTPISDEWKYAALSKEEAGGEHHALMNPDSHNAALMAGMNATMRAAKNAGRENAVRQAQRSLFGTGDEFEFTVGLMAGLILVKDLEFEGKDKYMEHAAERLEVYEKGYGLAGDVNGELYVFAVPKGLPELVRG